MTNKSPNFDERAEGIDLEYLVLHFTGTETAQEALDVYADAEAKLSAHYLVDVDGTVHALVDENKRAWHAGKSFWRGITDMNSHSIGIEVVNAGYKDEATPFPAVQITALIELCNDICNRYPKMRANVLGHSDIAPGRKIDPGHLFPWAQLAENNIGLWPEPEKEDFEPQMGLASTLKEIGYNPDCEAVTLVREFQRHFEPDAFESKMQGQSTDKTHALANWLLRTIGRSS